MSYRHLDKPPKPEDHLVRFAVRNGATLRIAFGCYYLQFHDKSYHDYIGWPSVNHPDHVCQIGPELFTIHRPHHRYTVDGEEIDLITEGYDEVTIEFDDQTIARKLKDVSAWIDEDDPFIVRIKLRADLDYFEDKPKETRFTVFISNPDKQQVDAVCHGFITILPGMPYSEE